MKKLKISITMAAFVVGAIGTSAFTAIEMNQSTAEYYVDASGNPIELVSGASDCDQSDSDACSATFNLDENNQPTGQGFNIITGERL